MLKQTNDNLINNQNEIIEIAEQIEKKDKTFSNINNKNEKFFDLESAAALEHLASDNEIEDKFFYTKGAYL